jgi:hypothetical protein
VERPIGFGFEYSTFGDVLVNEIPRNHGNSREDSRNSETNSKVRRFEYFISHVGGDSWNDDGFFPATKPFPGELHNGFRGVGSPNLCCDALQTFRMTLAIA